MQETIGSYLRRRYRWALASLVGGALAALLAGAVLGTGPAGLAFQAGCAVIWGGALGVAALTRCPACRARLAPHPAQVLPVLVLWALGTPPRRCPRCRAALEEPHR
jgi:hypothetical protein